MARLSGFDYTSPFHYLVTLTAKKGLEPFSILTEETGRGVRKTAITKRMTAIIFWMNQKAYAHRMKITHFVIMPNHLHLMIKIADGDQRISLIDVVQKLISVLSSGYYKALGLPGGPKIFEARWHDWIVCQRDTLNVFVDYIMDNPKRWLYRKKNSPACHPRSYQSTSITWTCLGTLSPRETPVRAPVICSRSITPGSDLWHVWKEFAQRLGPGTVAIGTFMSPCEKMVREEVLKAGGGIIHLIPRGISPKGHASAEDEPLLAAGRLTIMTPFPFEARTLTVEELHDRCHATLHPIALSLKRGIDALPPSR